MNTKAKQVQDAVTITVRRWGDVPSDTDWYLEELPRIASMIDDGYTSGEIVREDSAGGWWELSAAED